MDTTPTRRTMKVWADTIRTGERCRDPECGQVLSFATSIKTGRVMPFTGPIKEIARERDVKTGRPVWTLDLADSHFATCPGASHFRRGRR